MEFNNNKPIFIQISDMMCERVLRGEILAEERIPSVRDLGADLGVNPNTVARSYERLTAYGIIYNRRGIGYFITADARDKILEAQRKEFLETELPAFAAKMSLLGIDKNTIFASL